MTSTSSARFPGYPFSSVLDPHWREAMLRALERVLASGDTRLPAAGAPSVALVGWQAATLLDAVYARAARVVVIESDAELADNLQRSIVANGMGKKVTLLVQDPRQVILDVPVDVAIYAVTSPWFIEGQDAAVLANVRANVLTERGEMVPRRVVHLFELATPRTEIAGISVRFPRFSRPGEPVPVLSESKHFDTVDLVADGKLEGPVDDTVIVKPLLSGRVSALRLNTLVELADGVTQVSSQGSVQSIVVPLREDVEVRAGQPVSIHVRYTPGEGLASTRFSARALREDGPGTEGWAHAGHPVMAHFRQSLGAMVAGIDGIGRGADLDKVVGYTLKPQGDVNRLTALFWTVDEEFRKPLRQLVDTLRREASSELGEVPEDEIIYEVMLEVYRAHRPE